MFFKSYFIWDENSIRQSKLFCTYKFKSIKTKKKLQKIRLLIPHFPLMKSKYQQVNKKYSFKPIRFLKLNDMYLEIKKTEVEELGETMFPDNFQNLYQKILNTYFFQIQIKDEYKKWRIIKRLPELIQLKQTLKAKFPLAQQIFSFPQTDQQDIDIVYAPSILQLFCMFLRSIAMLQQLVTQKQFQLFIENYVSEDKKKLKTYFQRILTKKAGGRHTQSYFTSIFYNFMSWRYKFFTITREGLYYTDDQNSFQVRQILPFNKQFTFTHGEVKTGYTFGLIINSSHRVLQVDAQNAINFILFIYFLRKAIFQNSHIKTNRFESFAPVRQQCCSSEFYIDGKDYFQALNKQLRKAKKQIFITGWCLIPHMYLIQNYDSLQHRVDRILAKLATQGTKIYIIIYNAPKIAIDIYPEFTEAYLTSLHPNIKVLRHPNYLLIPFLWSHHQKIVVIDQKVAFLGGLDLGYGRMDDNQHRLTDEKQLYWKGIQYCNYRIADLTEVFNHQKCTIDRQIQPRMPWHDVGVKIQGPSVTDLCRHFIQYWNYVNFQLDLSQRQLILYAGIHQEELHIVSSSIEVVPIENSRNLELIQDLKLNKELKTQKDQIEIEISQNTKPTKASKFSKGNKAISFVSHKASKFYQDQPELKKMKSSNFIVTQQDSKQSQIEYYMSYLKSHPQNQSQIIGSKIDPQIEKIKRNEKQRLILKQIDEPVQLDNTTSLSKKNISKQTHQILRSASLWSLGIQQGKQESSILSAYLSLIENAKHFIYIENQFFIDFQNQVSTKIVERILRAHEKKEQFKVMIIIPFLPGFSGQIQDDTSAVVRVQVDLMYKTICRGQNSMYHKLSSVNKIDDYLAIYCLRNHSVLNGIPVTQIVYVHSKVLIIDDQVALIGSANINDRSLMGSRDSQIAIVIEDNNQIHVNSDIQNLPKLKVKQFAHQLRKKLYIQHFALTQKQAQNFFNQSVWQTIKFNAERNQKMYRKIFGCYPDDTIKNISDIQKLRQQAKPTRYDQLTFFIKGFACPFQKDFLCNQSLQLHSGQKEYYLPSINFT